MLGLPATLFGYDPGLPGYWYEPGLPWLVPGMKMPISYWGLKILACSVTMVGNSMAPRFPERCVVNVAPVVGRQNLVIGQVYLHVVIDDNTGREDYQLGRLDHIGGNHLAITFDNAPQPAMWGLLEDEYKTVVNVYEVTHYVSYPLEEEGATRE